MALCGLPPMTIYKHECRACKRVTEQIERIITDNLPPYVKTLQCTKCGVMGVCMVEEPKDATI